MANYESGASTATELGSSREDGIRSRQIGQTSKEPPKFTPALSPPRRPSSILSDSTTGISNIRQSFGDSTSDLLHPETVYDEDLHSEPSLWYSLPLLFAILPAVTGVAFKRGSVFLTDLALLVLAAIYLNWCLLTPWTWYHSAQSVRVSGQPIQGELSETAVGDETETVGSIEQNEMRHPDEAQTSPSLQPAVKSTNEETRHAIEELQLHELTALSLCFLGPLLGSYILHLIRSSLSQFGDELVSNMHLTLFVLAAEIRPLRYLMKIAHSRTLHLQRVVRKDPHAEGAREISSIQGLKKRLDNVEKSHTDLIEKYSNFSSKSSDPGMDVMRKPYSNLQNQIDALNRAVRRYEKRATAQTLQNEARLQDLEARLKEAVSLAAVAASHSQKPSQISNAAQSLLSISLLPFQTAFAAIAHLLHLFSSYFVEILERLGLVKIVRRRKSPRPVFQTKGVHGNNFVRSTRK